MCDTLAAVGGGRTLFAKNSDRPVDEVQVVEALPRRPPGGTLATEYLRIDDAGACAVLGSRPEWLWGLEHGVNEHGVAIGNEKVWTVDDPYAAEPALIGMDLVRLGLERARTAEQAVDVMTALLERHGQGGVADADARKPYWSSFLVADPSAAWVLETSGRSWVARHTDQGAAISNRLTLGTDWSRASTDVEAGTDWDRYRNPDAPTGHADRRLDVTRSCVATGAAALTPRDLVGVMRDHGGPRWGDPGAGGGGPVEPPPPGALPDGTGVTVCMHVKGYQATAASLVAELPAEPGAPVRAWVALGSPCASVYVPAFPPGHVPDPLGRPGTWKRFRSLRDRVEGEPDALAAVRAVLAPLEAELWEEADELVERPAEWAGFTERAAKRLEETFGALT